MVVHAITIFLGAFLLFSVQPMIAKAILPWFGGTAAVWTTCMLFFQMVLLLGYAYAHALIRLLSPLRQALVHITLIAVSAFLLRNGPDPRWKPTGQEDPILLILALLATTVGLPYFLLSTTGPLVQAWFSRTEPGKTPYRLYALSNLGSMLALVSYPVAVEPALTIHSQMATWAGGYLLFGGCCAVLAWKSRGAGFEPVAGRESVASPAPEWRRYLSWMSLAALASLLLLAVTNHICQNVAAIPFLWVLPLSLYLLSFIICFDRPQWYRPGLYRWLLAVCLAGMMTATLPIAAAAPLGVMLSLYSAGLFVCCMFCHGELWARRPDPSHLTGFYLMISLGGAIGGLLVAVVAPLTFPGYYELPLGLAACAAFVTAGFFGKRSRTEAVWVLLTLGLAFEAFVSIGGYGVNARAMVRNFYGTLRVLDDAKGTPAESQTRALVHGTVVHGRQFLDQARHLWPTTYYGPQSGAALAIHNVKRHSGIRIAAIGMGVGTIAVHAGPEDTIRFYEINPDVIELAEADFSFLKESKAKVELVLGDGRLSMEREPDSERYNVIVLDAFSGDSVPVHLLTYESFLLYLKHLTDDGVIALHISNKFLELEPVIRTASTRLHLLIRRVEQPEDESRALSRASWVLLTKDPDFFDRAGISEPPSLPITSQASLWTDDHSNQFQILK